MASGSPAVFFDKDGILNEVVMRGDDVSSPRTIQEFKLLSGAHEAVQAAKRAGFITIVATNQPDVALGRMTRSTLDHILKEISLLGFDGIEVCEDGTFTDRRCKPNPGMLFDATKTHNLDLSRSFFIGDHGRDIEAGKRAGVQTVLLQTFYNSSHHGHANFNFGSMGEIVEFLNTTAKALAFKKGDVIL